MKKVFTLVLLAISLLTTVVKAQRSAMGSPTNEAKDTTEVEDDPCIDISDQRFCWTLDPYTGKVRPAVPDTSYINYGATDVMEAKSLCLNYLGNLYSPAQSEQYFSRPVGNDFIFADAYSLFATSADRQIYYNTRIPFTMASYIKSGGNLQTNDHFMLNFAGNFSSKVGIGTSLDYVYARGEYPEQGTKPLKWLSYLYYTGEKYKAYASTNISFYGNQENGGITDRGYVLRPEQYNSNFTEARNMPTNLVDTWNSIRHHNFHFNHSYDIGFYDTRLDTDSSEYETFVPVSTIFQTLDVQTYDRTFRMDKGADAADESFFKNNYINDETTADSMGYRAFNTNIGIRLNEGFNKYSQFGLAAFIGFERQTYRNLQDTLDLSYINRKHISNNLWLGGQISRHLSSALTFDVTARTCVSGDKIGDVDLNGEIQTVIRTGANDSLIITAGGFIRNNRASYFMDHFFSNHFRWSNDFDREQRMRVQGSISYPRSATMISAGVEHVNNLHYFNDEGLPEQYDRQMDIFSLEAQQSLHAGILYFDNSLLFQTSTDDKVLSLPKLSVRTDLSIRFKFAHALQTQLGVSGYYHTLYFAPNYQPATQQFCVQNDIQCGNFPVFNGYANFRLKQCRFFFMMYNMLDGVITNDTFIAPYYPTMPRRFEWGVSIDFQN